jgi:hypothetical protein
MANYIIIGADGREYGPVTDADIRQWIAEARLNGQSRAKSESDAEFRPLATFPEFANVLGTGAPPRIAPPTPGNLGQGSEREAALQAVKGPAICLKIVAILSFVLSLWGLIKILFFRSGVDEEISRLLAQHPELQEAQFQQMLHMIFGPIGIGSNLFAMLMSAIIFWGVTWMQQLKNIEVCYVAAILAIFPCATNCCAWVFGVPFGIWALVVLSKPWVKSQFH